MEKRLRIRGLEYWISGNVFELHTEGQWGGYLHTYAYDPYGSCKPGINREPDNIHDTLAYIHVSDPIIA